MFARRFVLSVLLLPFCLCSLCGQKAAVKGLRTDLLLTPELSNGSQIIATKNGDANDNRIGSQNPSLGWEVDGKQTKTQSAYQIIVYTRQDSHSSDSTLVWDSGKITSTESSNIRYEGAALLPNYQYAWRVRIWDTNNEPSGWSTASRFLTSSLLVDYKTPAYPLLKTDETPKKTTVSGETLRFDFGKASFGQLRLTIETKKENDTATVRMGETVLADGSINRQPGGSIRYAEYVIPLRKGRHTYHVQVVPDPRNTGPMAILLPDYIGQVLPFRYVELEGAGSNVDPVDIIRATVHYPFDDLASHFESSDSTLNAIWELCKYSIKATSFAGIYVDGDRERIPYEVDAVINQLSHYAVDGEYSMARRSLEHLTRNTTWFTDCILHCVFLAYHDYLYTGDIRSIRKDYDALKAKLLLPLRDSTGLMSTRTGKRTPALMESLHAIKNGMTDLVDWPHPGRNIAGETDGFVFTKYNSVINAFHYKALQDMAVLAEALGKKNDVALFKKAADDTRHAFQTLLWDEKRRVFKDGIDTEHAALHTNTLALAFDLVMPQYKQDLLTFIRSIGMACGPYGSQYLMDAVYQAGDADYGLAMLTSKEERSWFNMIRLGSTITTETWNVQYKPNWDWNHAWGTVPANIIQRKLMGVEPLEPGWKSFQIRPQTGSLEYARIKVPTIRGAIEVSCRRTESKYVVGFTVPGNTVANLVLPVPEKTNWQATVNGKEANVEIRDGLIHVPNFTPGTHQVHLILN